MASKKRPFTGLLLKAIDVNDAPSQSLRAALALPPDGSDRLAYARTELRARWAALDEFFGLSSNAADIWKQRTKALIARQFEISTDDPQLWERLACRMAVAYVPGFSSRQPGKKKHGAPGKWNDERLARLLADVEYLKRTRRMTVRQICQQLPRKKDYAKRWGYFRPAALRKAYSEAKKRSRGLLFQLVLCGPAATIPANRIDPIEAAIELHALKVIF